MDSRGALHLCLLILAAESLCGLPTDRNITESSPQSRAKERQEHLNLEHLQQENLLQTLHFPSSPSSRDHMSQHHHQDLLPPPVPKVEPEAFILDLRSFPGLANADVGSQNPNIQLEMTWTC
ncbi:hypothetical protein ATANTOWER_010071 [Ataeniobius toweri]|uniref:Uncharacterized protein n=1 Tax=Ataeniobius toweri TaxID=208326 RepID=A0ABU7CJ57_9TELE|nr:hypothetical protein [Ataeniobius toweri]